jgi:hypothetical protein
VAGSSGSGRGLSLGLARQQRRNSSAYGSTPNAAIAASSVTCEDADSGSRRLSRGRNRGGCRPWPVSALAWSQCRAVSGGVEYSGQRLPRAATSAAVVLLRRAPADHCPEHGSWSAYAIRRRTA